jgi:hypothetical protein
MSVKAAFAVCQLVHILGHVGTFLRAAADLVHDKWTANEKHVKPHKPIPAPEAPIDHCHPHYGLWYC